MTQQNNFQATIGTTYRFGGTLNCLDTTSKIRKFTTLALPGISEVQQRIVSH